MATTVSQMTEEELQEFIENTIERKIFELLVDPDIGLPLRKTMQDKYYFDAFELLNIGYCNNNFVLLQLIDELLAINCHSFFCLRFYYVVCFCN